MSRHYPRLWSRIHYTLLASVCVFFPFFTSSPPLVSPLLLFSLMMMIIVVVILRNFSTLRFCFIFSLLSFSCRFMRLKRFIQYAVSLYIFFINLFSSSILTSSGWLMLTQYQLWLYALEGETAEVLTYNFHVAIFLSLATPIFVQSSPSFLVLCRLLFLRAGERS